MRKRLLERLLPGSGKTWRSRKLLIYWCREGGSNPHDLAIGGF